METITTTLKRESFRAIPRIVDTPNLIEVQVNSYNWFLEEGLRGLLETFSPIEDQTGSTALYLVDYRLGEPAYSVEECRDRDMTYEARIWVTARLVKRATNEIEEAEVYLGDLPQMTGKGTFVINGSERVVVSQLARSPGVYFRDTMDFSGRQLFSAQVIPGEGAWVQIDTDANNIIWVRIGQTKKFPITTLIRAFNSFRPEALTRTSMVYAMPADAADLVDQRLGEPVTVPLDARHLQPGQMLAESIVDPNTGEILADKSKPLDPEVIAALRELKMHEIAVVVEPGAEIDNRMAQRLIASGRKTITLLKPSTPCSSTNDLLMLFGRPVTVDKPNKDNVLGRRLVQDVKNPETGEILVRAINPEDKSYQIIDREIAKQIEAANLDSVDVLVVNEYVEKSLNQDRLHNVHAEREALIDIYRNIRPGDPATVDSGKSLLANVFVDRRRYDLAKVGRYKLNKKLGFRYDPDSHPMPLDLRSVTKEDLVMVVRYIVALAEMQEGETPILRTDDFLKLRKELGWKPTKKDYSDKPDALAIAKRLGDFDYLRDTPIPVTTDDIDHLENKRVRSVGELLQNAFRLGMIRMEKVAKERMASLDASALTPQAIISVKPVSAAIKSFFGSSQLSQFMDQINPLAELTHKRRLSALGPGGLSRQNAKLEVRDVHHSHYGRICPIETPEGPNIGLINYMTSYAKVDEYGFLKTPYWRVTNGVVDHGTPIYMTADEEDGKHVITANVKVLDDGAIEDEYVPARFRSGFPTIHRDQVELMDVSPMQIVSPTTAMIPFLENDDANRALMGANMQKQAVPLVVPEAPLVRTGMEGQTARDSGAVMRSEVDGIVTSVSPRRIIVKDRTGQAYVYNLMNMIRSNNATCITQRAIVQAGDRVRKDQAIADGPSTDSGVMALGRNVLVAFMPWGGYNYEDAILLSERLIKDDVYTSIHIEKYEHEARDTKLGPEEITRDIPNIGDEALRDLDERGIIRIGAEVAADEVLVGKVVPKGQGELTAEEKLVIAIFGKKAEETRDVSLRLPHGEKGKVVDVKVFSRFKYGCPKCDSKVDFSKRPEGNVTCDRCGADLERLPGDELSAGVNQLVRVYVAQKRKVMEGDKMAGRHGNKGVVSKILPEMDMPFLPDGTPVDIVLNPLGVGARMNIGQVMETHLGFAAKELGVYFECPIFEGARDKDITRWIHKATDRVRVRTLTDMVESEFDLPELVENVPHETTTEEWATEMFGGSAGVDLSNFTGDAHSDAAKPIGEPFDSLLKRVTTEMARLPEERRAPVLEYLGLEEGASETDISARLEANVNGRTGIDPDSGKAYLKNGQTGEPFDYPVTIGEIYMLKLAHLVEDKIHARSTGPYSLVTQQPLGGKALFGGQRFGEMEVWALEAYGAAFTLQEILTIKSDDVLGRVKTYESIVKGESILDPGVPESFKILVKELQSLGLAVGVESETGEELDLKTDDEELADQDRAGAARRRKQRIMRLQEDLIEE
ncbi:MAG TPA: DNA-directed RNA polymerase subunit beta [Armatimonadota bacterium]|nr:DNA-directed RNA polymerase subunit beta [Armatimonadota bacterium]